MTKKKKNEQRPADFRSNPFKALKGFTSQTPAHGHAVSPARRKSESMEPEDERALFLRAAAGARRIQDEALPPAAPLHEAGATRQDRHAGARDQELFLAAMKRIGTELKNKQHGDDEAVDAQRRSPSSRMRQLKRGTIRIGQELDLHGFLRDDAVAALARFITNAYNRDLDAVLVITGKGVNSPEGPVLQGAAAEWLRQRGKGMVAEFAPAPRDKGGSGAYVVFLKKK